MINLKNKKAVISGATGGIGYSILEKFHSEGVTVLGSGTNDEKLSKLKNDFSGAIFKKFDISKHDEIEEFVETVCDELKGCPEILINNANLYTPGSPNPIIKDLSLSIHNKDTLLVTGPSGCGKTSLLRMISGLWQPDLGSIQIPKTGEMLFIPQKPYMLLGSLREQLCYPTEVNKFSDEHLVAVLDEVNLSSLINRYPNLDIKQDWPRILSLGEQQRLAFARLLLNSPRFAVLDEATSALDIETEKRLYNLLRERELSLISVGHRPSLKDFHENILELNGKGNWKLFTSDKYNFNN